MGHHKASKCPNPWVFSSKNKYLPVSLLERIEFELPGYWSWGQKKKILWGLGEIDLCLRVNNLPTWKPSRFPLYSPSPPSLCWTVQFSRSVVSLQPHGPQHARPPCLSPTPRVYSNSRPLSRWCHPTISSSVVTFSSCLQSFPASGSFQMSQLFTSGGQSTGVSASASVPPMNTQDWSPLGWTGWISLQSKGLSRVFSNTTVQKHQLVSAQLSSQSNSHIHTRLYSFGQGSVTCPFK